MPDDIRDAAARPGRTSSRQRPQRRTALALAGAALAAGGAVLWSFVVPDRADIAHGLRAAAIRYGHPAAWALLCLWCLLVAARAPVRARAAAAYAALAAYLAFLAGLLL
ncbi:hypothetical protein [Tessaracoccus defluvii]|uniref:Uncharacterized protein n=1 Tax=Tessaracoccus defluvii TaxID=1285901 RepID=A0A7H0H7X9_9ACTN|nr:hypothetical protein [Tessaracoccus defluvii]QNP56645.1 hypothetical protein H9L22_04380 [Tessaracoccus defluvii]